MISGGRGGGQVLKDGIEVVVIKELVEDIVEDVTEVVGGTDVEVTFSKIGGTVEFG